jgi:hypothetical protein
VKFKRSSYFGAPCCRASGRWFWFDADWNTRFPFGTSLGLRVGRRQEAIHKPGCETDCQCRISLPPHGFTLDVNAPAGEPNRLYIWLARWHVTLALPQVRAECADDSRRPRIGSIGRYRYHQDSDGKWVRNDKPDPLYWGWLTIGRAARDD